MRRRYVRGLCVWMAMLLLTLGLSACGSAQTEKETESLGIETEEKEEGKSLKIIAVMFPEYDWLREILGERLEEVELEMLLDSGIDVHSYEPSLEDILEISSCDLFVYAGGESSEWVDEVLKQSQNPQRKVLSLLELLGSEAKEEEYVEGMERTEEHEAHEGEEEESEYDEHVWLSLRNAERFTQSIADTLGELDEENAEYYQSRQEAYRQKLADLDERYQMVVEAAPQKTLIFGDRFPFRYLTEDYGLSYYAAFAGCSTEINASFETIVFLADKMKELEISKILTIEKSDEKIAKTVLETANLSEAEILTLDSLQSVNQKEIEEGKTYLSTMEENLEVLQKALQ
ncbi:MAG: metal ABC transporter substrate-binding protein [bacterium]|nr:metal ABC transporter substrate-binding protein [bacterium]